MYYDQDYFDWQKKIGELSAKANTYKYNSYINPTDKVIDFGSGGGFLLKNLVCSEKIGIEINPIAIDFANKEGIKTVSDIDLILDNWADVIISSHALEHTHNPLNELRQLSSKLKKGGKFVFVTPFERTNSYRPNDINQHLFTWSPMNLGNLFSTAGLNVLRCEELMHRFPPKPFFWASLGDIVFQAMCKLTALVRRDLSQVIIVAEKTS